jgi:hypothetical protein
MEFLSHKEWHNTVHFPYSRGTGFARDDLFNNLSVTWLLQSICTVQARRLKRESRTRQPSIDLGQGTSSGDAYIQVDGGR